MTSSHWFGDVSDTRLQDGISPRMSNSPWSSEDELSSFGNMDDHGIPTDPILASRTLIPWATDHRGFESIQHFIPDPFGKSFATVEDGDVNLNSCGLGLGPLSDRRAMFSIAGIRSPVTSVTDDQSVTDWYSPAAYALSDRASDAGPSYPGTRRPSERETGYARTSTDYGCSVIDNGFALSYSGGSGYAAGPAPSYVDPRNVQQSCGGTMAENDGSSVSTSEYPVILEAWPPHLTGLPYEVNDGIETGPMVKTEEEHDGEQEQEDQGEDEEQHSDYQPDPAPRRSKRGQGRSLSSSSGRVSKGGRPTKHCSAHPGQRFKNTSELRKHIYSVHQPRFSCIFAKYGCDKRFGSKNEWKRHINCIHLRLDFWRCDVDGCADQGGVRRHGDDDGDGEGAKEFNRKDLFTQHLRRMHCPLPAEHDGNMTAYEKKGWEDQIAAAQDRCHMINRTAPNRGRCGFCDQEYVGEGCWDDCLEHVGKHFENVLDVVGVVTKGGAGTTTTTTEWREDEWLRTWLIREGLLERRDVRGGAGGGGGGRWVISGNEKRRR